MKPILSAIALVLLVAAGCDTPANLRVLPLMQPAEVPAANLDERLRPTNWTDARGSGSCVIASSVYNLLWADKIADAEAWRKAYAGGQTETSIRQKYDANHIGYHFTRNADPAFLWWVTKTRRSALIWYYPSHCVNFVGFHTDPTRPNDSATYAWLCDNNRPARFIRVPYDEFCRNWSGYGGFGLAVASPPVPPTLYDALWRP